MGMKGINVTITGESPLLMHRYPAEPVEALEKKTPAEQAEIAAYRDPDTKGLYIPATAVQRTLVNGATYSKGKGRASLQKTAAACLLVSPPRLALDQKEFEVDSQPVVVPATKGRVMRHRPRLDKWAASFLLEYDDVLLSAQQVRDIVDNSGSRVGLLDFRPEKKGPYGRFKVTHWDPIK